MYVITRNVQTELVVQKSRFLTSLYRVSTEIEAQAKIKALKKNIGMPIIIARPISSASSPGRALQ